MKKWKDFLGQEKNVAKIISSVLIFSSLVLIFGPGVYAGFIGSTGDSSVFEYQYGYGTSYGYGYGYGDGGEAGYGFEGTTGVATSISAAATSRTSFTVSYTTNYLAQNRIEYGLTTSLGSANSYSNFETGANSLTISDLLCGTTYYYQVDSKDAGGNVWSAAIGSVATLSCGGGSGGGGGSTSSPTTPSTATTTPPVTPAIPATPAVPGVSPAVPATPASPAQSCRDIVTNAKYGSDVAKIATGLKVGSRGTTVKALQQFLNNNGFTVAPKGAAGSSGKETTLFGGATKAALIKFQKAKNIKPADGTVNVATRAYFKANYGTYANSSFLRGCDGKIYILKAGKKVQIKSLAELKKYKKVVLNNVSNEVLNKYPTQ